MSKIKGTGAITSADFKAVKWVGKTKDGNAVTISMTKAINLGNIDWTFADKNDVVSQVVFTGVYSNTNETASSTEENWEVETSGQTSGASEIMLGAGVFFIGDTKVALTRGGGKFTVEREFREIAADGDRGPVEDRIEMDASRATLTLNTLQILTRMADLYAGISVTE